MKYRLDKSSEEINVILEDGGVACIRAIDGSSDMPNRKSTTDYYQSRFTQEDIDKGEVWESVGEGKMYYNDWETSFDNPKHIQDALEWLCVDCDGFEVDETIWEDF